MIGTIEFNEMTAMLLDYCGSSSEGVKYLRYVGDEPIVNSIWARLSSRETRDKAWSSGVTLSIPGRSHPEYVAFSKGWTYKTLKTRLPCGLVDVAMIHPMLTVSEDSENGFYILTYETDGLPSGFFERLNRSLAIPLIPAWASFLWTQGQQAQSRFVLETKTVTSGGQESEKTTLKESTELPIIQLKGMGDAAVYSVHTGGKYKDAWLQIIRDQLDLGILMAKPIGDPHQYACYPWKIAETGSGDAAWKLYEADEEVFAAPTLNYLLAQAREELGLNLLIAGGA